jgi:hypothetical protein
MKEVSQFLLFIIIKDIIERIRIPNSQLLHIFFLVLYIKKITFYIVCKVDVSRQHYSPDTSILR